MIEIQTEYVENYGTAEYPVWKNKGGEIYLVECEAEMPELFKLIEFSNPYACEFVFTHRKIDEDEDDDMYDIEFHNMTYLNKVDGVWKARRSHTSDGFRKPINSVTETWDFSEGQQRSNYNAVYTLDDGSKMTREEFIKQYVSTKDSE